MKRVIASFFSALQSVLPDRPGKALLRALWRGQGRPKTYRDPEQHPSGGLGRGSVTFSLDFELAWAWRYSKRMAGHCVEIGLRERAQVPIVLAEFDRHRMPATWATVGHLFLDSCRRGEDGRAHPEIPRIPPFQSRWWEFDGADWFVHDPCTDVSRDPAWYAPDLIARIKASPVGHEIACHSFSHLGFGTYCPHEAAVAELRACRGLMEAAGVEATTFVHPGNDFGNFEAIIEAGFSIIRIFPWDQGEISLPVVRPDGLWVVPAAACLQEGEETSPQRLRGKRRRLELLVDSAVATGLNAHVWLHPSILPAQIEHVLSPFLAYCARLRDAGDLDVLTMRSLVAETRARRQRTHACGEALAPGV